MEWKITKIAEDCFEGYNFKTGAIIIDRTRKEVGRQIQINLHPNNPERRVAF